MIGLLQILQLAITFHHIMLENFIEYNLTRLHSKSQLSYLTKNFFPFTKI